VARPAKNYVVWRNSSAMVRVQVTDEQARKIIGKTALTHTIGKVNKCEAAQLAHPIVADFLGQIERAKAGTYTLDDDRPVYTTRDSIGVRMVRYPPPASGTWVWQEYRPSDNPVSFTEILAIWKLENENPNTFKKFTGMMAKLAAFAGTDDAKRITPRQIVEFETSLRQAGKHHPNTISNYIACYNAVFTFAKQKFLIDTNPMTDVKVPGKIDTDILPYTPEEVRLIVTAAQKLRIELYLCVIVQAYTGVRISEIANRHTSEIRQEDGVWCLVIPNGKTASSKRIIPLHPALLKVLLPYRQLVIEQYGEGLLFPDLPGGSKGEPGAYATRELCEWIRDEKKGVGITDKKIQPNHSYRHYVKSQLYTAKVDVKTRDMICGHGTNVARKYEHGDIEQMLEAIQKLPNPLA
jgi:integrase